jgi:hypothetical protein
MTTEVTLNPSVTNVTVSSTDALSVDLTTSTTTVELANGLILPQALGTGDSPTFSSVTADEFIGDLRGAVRFQAKAGENLTKGDVVYISGVSGQKPVVSKARANSATTMPAFGLANSTVNNNANLEVISFGTFAHGNTTGGAENWEIGDVLYISSTTAGALTNLKPSGESNLIQNIGKVERVHASSGSIMVAGAGRTAATPNLDEGKFFIGDSNNYSSTGSFNNQFINTNGTISLSNNIAISGTVNAAAYTGSQTIANYVTDTAIDVTEFATYTGKKIIYTGAASTISLPNVVAADIGKSWTIVNAGTGVLTVDVDASGTAQQVRHAHAGGVNTSTTNRTIAIGGIVEVICIAEDSSGITNSSDKPNYLIYGSGVI